MGVVIRFRVPIEMHCAIVSIGRKLGDYAPLGKEQQRARLTQCRVGRDLPPYQLAS